MFIGVRNHGTPENMMIRDQTLFLAYRLSNALDLELLQLLVRQWYSPTHYYYAGPSIRPTL